MMRPAGGRHEVVPHLRRRARANLQTDILQKAHQRGLTDVRPVAEGGIAWQKPPRYPGGERAVMVGCVMGTSQISRTKRTTATVLRNRCTMESVVPWRAASAGRIAGFTTQRSSWVTIRVALFLGSPRGVRVRRSASEE